MLIVFTLSFKNILSNYSSHVVALVRLLTMTQYTWNQRFTIVSKWVGTVFINPKMEKKCIKCILLFHATFAKQSLQHIF